MKVDTPQEAIARIDKKFPFSEGIDMTVADIDTARRLTDEFAPEATADLIKARADALSFELDGFLPAPPDDILRFYQDFASLPKTQKEVKIIRLLACAQMGRLNAVDTPLSRGGVLRFVLNTRISEEDMDYVTTTANPAAIGLTPEAMFARMQTKRAAQRGGRRTRNNRRNNRRNRSRSRNNRKTRSRNNRRN
jgi:hypothetical protein